MENYDKNKVQIKNLLESYSLEEISELFSNIDEKILTLHNYSSEDFLNLNKDFKQFYQRANTISDNVSYLFEFLAGQANQYLPVNIEAFHNQLKERNNVMEDQVEATSAIIKELLSKVRQAFFPIKNFKQNLTSLRFLETSLELEYNTGENLQPHVIGDISGKAKEQLKITENAFYRLKKLIKERLLDRNKLYEEDVNIKDVLENLENELKIYQDYYEKARKQIPEIKERTEKTKDSIGKIITNLQYQDIIKQRMEHIHSTHKDLVAEMNKVREEKNNQDLNEKAKYFLRIRDIAGLQAAQLLQTNKEYQTAIQRISDKFLEIGEEMSFVANQGAEYTSFDNDKQKIFFDALKKNLGYAKQRIQAFCDLSNSFVEDVQEIRDILNAVLQYNRNCTLLIEDIKKFVEIKKGESSHIEDSTRQSEIFKQISQLVKDLESNKENMDRIFGDIAEYKDDLDNKVLNNASGNGSEKKVGDLPEQIGEYIFGLNKVETKILEKLTENNTLSERILSDIQKSVSNIKYYDHFENIIEGIIDELNTINYKLRFDEDDVFDKDENLKKLTEYYTMNSEYVIHDQVANGNHSEIDVSEDGGDLELF